MAGHMSVQQFQRPTGGAAGQLGGLPGELGIARLPDDLAQHALHARGLERRKIEPDAARPDRRQEISGGMADDEENGARRRLLEDLQRALADVLLRLSAASTMTTR